MIDLIGATPVSVDDLVRLSEVPAKLVQAILMELELEGAVSRHGANLVSRVAASSSDTVSR